VVAEVGTRDRMPLARGAMHLREVSFTRKGRNAFCGPVSAPSRARSRAAGRALQQKPVKNMAASSRLL
jgi:hypothetical protein